MSASGATPISTFAVRCFKVSRAIHWVTVALVCALLATALFGGIDPHGAGNDAFLWHSSLGIALYVLSMSRVILWLIYRPTARAAGASARSDAAHRASQIAFYALLLAVPISGWYLAAEEGTSAHLLGAPALPQWSSRAAAPPSSLAGPREAAPSGHGHAARLHRIHAMLAAALSVAVAAHVFIVFRAARRRDKSRPETPEGDGYG